LLARLVCLVELALVSLLAVYMSSSLLCHIIIP